MVIRALFLILLLTRAATATTSINGINMSSPRRLRRANDAKRKLNRELKRSSRLLGYDWKPVIVDRGGGRFRALQVDESGDSNIDGDDPSSPDSPDSVSEDSTPSVDESRRRLSRRSHKFGYGGRNGKGNAYGVRKDDLSFSFFFSKSDSSGSGDVTSSPSSSPSEAPSMPLIGDDDDFIDIPNVAGDAEEFLLGGNSYGHGRGNGMGKAYGLYKDDLSFPFFRSASSSESGPSSDSSGSGDVTSSPSSRPSAALSIVDDDDFGSPGRDDDWLDIEENHDGDHALVSSGDEVPSSDASEVSGDESVSSSEDIRGRRRRRALDGGNSSSSKESVVSESSADGRRSLLGRLLSWNESGEGR